MENIDQVEGGVGGDDNPKNHFVEVMHDASHALGEKNVIDLGTALEQARAIAEMLDDKDKTDALGQIDVYERKMEEIKEAA